MNNEFADFSAFTNLKPAESAEAKAKLDDIMRVESDTWARKRKLQALSLEHEQDGFLAGLTTEQGLDNFMDSILPKPSAATSLLKLQEEFEDLRLSAERTQAKHIPPR